MAYNFKKLVSVLWILDIGMWRKNHNELKITINTQFVSIQKMLKEFREEKGVSVQEGLMEKMEFAQALCEDFDRKAENQKVK